MLRCPICRKQVPPRPENRAFPFCSERCQLIDLGRWLGEEYRVPVRPEETEDEMPELLAPRDDDGPAS